MQTTRVFKCGNSMAVRLPKGYTLQGKEVEIRHRGKDIVLRELPKDMSRAFELLTELSLDGFSQPRRDDPPQSRESF